MIISTELAKQLIATGKLILGDYFIDLEGQYYVPLKKFNKIN